jgi:hypothetical protein
MLIFINIKLLKIIWKEKLVGEKLNRSGVLTFSQSIIKILQLWNRKENSDDSLYSLIVNGSQNSSVNEDIYVSLPVKFENGTFKTKNVFTMNDVKNGILNEIIKVIEFYTIFYSIFLL